MPIELGLASSHAPSVDAAVEVWPAIYDRLRRQVPQPPEAALETPEVITDYVARINSSFEMLKDKLEEYGTELLILIGGDQTEMFDRSNVPNLMIYAGDIAWGHNNNGLAGEKPSEEDMVRLKVDVTTSQRLLNQLVREDGFDIAISNEQEALGRAEKGLAHAFTRPAPHLTPKLDIPVIVIYENTFDTPSLSAARCYKLGKSLARFFKDDPRKIAIYGSGGLSHDPGGPRVGWIDEPLDRWFLDQIQAGHGEDTTSLYQFDSMTMRGGTGEIRAWITVAGALEEMGSTGATIIDYIPANHAVTGLGWAYWPQSSLRAVTPA